MFDDKRAYRIICEAEEALRDIFREHDEKALINQQRVLSAMQKHRLAERHFASSTGYGYNDEGRDITEAIYADVFGAEKALVRPHIVSGTHAIWLSLTGLLRPGDNFVSATGAPYDTIYSNIGVTDSFTGMGTLREFGIEYRQCDLTEKGEVDYPALRGMIDGSTKMVYVQRSTGYSLRDAITVDTIADIVRAVKEIREDIIVFVDNCYGEFIDTVDPTGVGADVMAGSLIKNPGGGLAQSGGYICGKEKYVDMIASRLTAPSIAYEVGASLGTTRSYLQGLFLAPSVVNNAVREAVLTAIVMEGLGYEVFPGPSSPRSDIIQAIVFNDPQKVLDYCAAIQSSSPVDSYVTPEAWDMPGYDEPVVMAAGNFIQGSSIELSADSPMRAPYVVYQQGGLTYEHVKIALYEALKKLLAER